MSVNRRRKIDIHQHYYPPAYAKRHIDRIVADSPSYSADIYLNWSADAVLENMERWGIDRTILSLTSPGVWFGDVQGARRDAQLCNEFGAEIVASAPRKFGLFATLTLPDQQGSIAEIEHAYAALDACGVSVLTSYDGVMLGDPAFFPVLELLNEKRAVVFVHPTAYRGTQAVTNPWLIPPILEFPFDTTRAIISLIFSGALTRFPDIRFVFCHAGGTLPMLFHRIQGAAMQIHGREAVGKVAPDGLQALVGRLHFDIVSAANSVAWPAIRALYGPDQLLFGTDNPFVPTEVTVNGLATVESDPDVLAGIEAGNAERLLGTAGFS